MSKNTLPPTSGASKVTFTNIILQLGQRCDYTNFTPMPMLRDQVRAFAQPGIHELEDWLPDAKVSLQLRSPVGSYQYAFLRHQGQGIAVMHAGLDTSGARQAWGAAHALNQDCIDAIISMGPKEVASGLAKFLQSHSELTLPTGPAMVTSLLPAILETSPMLYVLEGFTRQLFWALHERHIASKWMAA
ncbi:MAG: hypothetical protein JSS11_05800 [Verrucomicrobia bacterium]|nr:hypothetical protein [Verrucomicrobiota bacterium]